MATTAPSFQDRHLGGEGLERSFTTLEDTPLRHPATQHNRNVNPKILQEIPRRATISETMDTTRTSYPGWAMLQPGLWTKRWVKRISVRGPMRGRTSYFSCDLQAFS